MAIKDLLVAFNDDEGARNALTFGLQMAKKYDAALTGLYAYQPQSYGGGVKRWIPDDVFENMTQAEADSAKEIEKAFHAQVKEAGHKGEVHFHIETGQPDLMLARTSRYHDLLITGQFVGALNRERKAIQPEQILERAGKPVIVVPAKYKVRPFKEEAAVAWDASRSAARALTDAMQILETKKKLDILTVNPDGEDGRHGEMPERDIAAHLKRHGVKAAHVTLEAEAHGIAQAILAHCEQDRPGRAGHGGLWPFENRRGAVRRRYPACPGEYERAAADVTLTPGRAAARAISTSSAGRSPPEPSG